MRPLRNLGVVVLLMAAASGCAGMQSRVSWPTHPSDEPGQSRLASWFKSRSLFRLGIGLDQPRQRGNGLPRD